jgi:hypothetical protein
MILTAQCSWYLPIKLALNERQVKHLCPQVADAVEKLRRTP